ncbi:MAG: hypothetical protein ACI9W2_000484 [Gammaproteobacteria bacterium]|jgi:hypothetical protein
MDEPVLRLEASQPYPHVVCCRGPSGHSHTTTPEPLRTGIPFARGALQPGSLSGLSLVDDAGHPCVTQSKPLLHWSDGSVRWLQVDWVATALVGRTWSLQPAASLGARANISIERRLNESTIRNEFWAASITPSNPIISFADHNGNQFAELMLNVSAYDQTLTLGTDTIIEILDTGPVRASFSVTSRLVFKAPIDVRLTVHLFAALPWIQVELSVTNPGPATHPGGTWPLGAGGSIFLDELSMALVPTKPASKSALSQDDGSPLSECHRFDLTQASSGGENWPSTNHVTADGTVTLPYCGYHADIDGAATEGLRATPLAAIGDNPQLVLSMPYFWQNFPKRVQGDPATGLTLSLFPLAQGVPHELQGGERKTHSFNLWVNPYRPTPIHELEPMRAPAVVGPDPSWCESVGAIPFVQSESPGAKTAHALLIAQVLDGEHSFSNKREQLDEFGWRNFGDVLADHELSYYQESLPLISHYNNQYDIVFGCAQQFLRTADARWFDEMSTLALHVSDIDIYHTSSDRSAYNHGLFWHTAHDVSAATSTHRTYPKSTAGGSGGPSCEHVYASGLALHYYLTGSLASYNAVLELAQFVIECDDPKRTRWRWLSSNPTGLSSQTGSPRYHGPGRGAGNAISVLIDAFVLTREEPYLRACEALIHRAIHPHDDIESRDLRNPEVRWSYMVFLRALLRYLDAKAEYGGIDRAYRYTKASLLHYCRWVVEYEYFYLDEPTRLLEPTETWAAQEFRKSEVLDLAARLVLPPERAVFRERAAFFHRRALGYLQTSPTSHYARPMALAMAFGHQRDYFQAHPDDGVNFDPTELTHTELGEQWGKPTPFVPQRRSALQRAAAITLGAAVLLTAGMWTLV